MPVLAVLSGKGGTGKTTIAVSLFVGRPGSLLLDADVEEPNCHLFLSPAVDTVEVVQADYPMVDPQLCDRCGRCGDFCRFHAILPAPETVLVYRELCHGCGGCRLVCPNEAICYKKRAVGHVRSGEVAGAGRLWYGELTVGEMSGVRLIERLRKEERPGTYTIVDAPPGTSCSAAAAVRGAEYGLLVAEPSPLGASDLRRSIGMLRGMGIPMGVVINKAVPGETVIHTVCREERIPVLCEIPFEKEVASLLAGGTIPGRVLEPYRARIQGLWDVLQRERRGPGCAEQRS